MNYYIDTEFHEYHKQQKVLGIKVGKPTPTIDLISIGIVSEDVADGNHIYSKREAYVKVNLGRDHEIIPPEYFIKECMTERKYYAICNEFDIDDAWDSFQMKQVYGDMRNRYPDDIREHWLRENVLKPIFDELLIKLNSAAIKQNYIMGFGGKIKKLKFTKKNFKRLIKKYGKTKKQIAEEIKTFVYADSFNKNGGQAIRTIPYPTKIPNEINPIEFYAFYADYDWVVFCQLFGKMIDLPKGFPMYCTDLKQTLDEKANKLTSFELSKLAHGCNVKHNVYSTLDNGVLQCSKSDLLKNALNYPKQENEHNALDDAKWNKKLHEFLKTI